jgi:putative holliday junction resolvase
MRKTTLFGTETVVGSALWQASRIIKGMVTSSGRRHVEGDTAANLPQARARRILAIDYGRKRIGLALSDELGLTAQPLATFVRTNRRSDLHHLRETCRKQAVGQIVVGHPLHMTGEAGEMAEEAKRFAARLEKELGIGVVLVDERLTSWEAEQMAIADPQFRRKNKHLDGVAAAVLLRDYLNQTRGETSDSVAQEE